MKAPPLTIQKLLLMVKFFMDKQTDTAKTACVFLPQEIQPLPGLNGFLWIHNYAMTCCKNLYSINTHFDASTTDSY